MYKIDYNGLVKLIVDETIKKANEINRLENSLSDLKNVTNKTLSVENKMQEVYQEIRDIFGDNARVFINIHGDDVSTRVSY